MQKPYLNVIVFEDGAFKAKGLDGVMRMGSSGCDRFLIHKDSREFALLLSSLCEGSHLQTRSKVQEEPNHSSTLNSGLPGSRLLENKFVG